MNYPHGGEAVTDKLFKRNTSPICIKRCIVRNPVIFLNARATFTHFPWDGRNPLSLTLPSSNYVNDDFCVIVKHTADRRPPGGGGGNHNTLNLSWRGQKYWPVTPPPKPNGCNCIYTDRSNHTLRTSSAQSNSRAPSARSDTPQHLLSVNTQCSYAEGLFFPKVCD